MDCKMNKKDIENEIVSALKDILGDSQREIRMDHRLIDDLEISSLETMELMSLLEEKFDCTIDVRRSREFVTVNDIAELMTAMMDEV